MGHQVGVWSDYISAIPGATGPGREDLFEPNQKAESQLVDWIEAQMLAGLPGLSPAQPSISKDRPVLPEDAVCPHRLACSPIAARQVDARRASVPVHGPPVPLNGSE